MTKAIVSLIIVLNVFWIADAQAAMTVIIGLDNSNSAPLVVDKTFPKQAAKRVYDLIKNLKYGDNVILRSFGEYIKRKNTLTQDFHLTRRLNPEAVARSVGKFIAGFGANGHKIEEEQTTNILGFLENMVAEYSCSDHDVLFILLSDGLEFSELSNSYEIVKTGKGKLPKLEFSDFQSCGLQIWGFGYGIGPAGVQNLKHAWFAWTKEAGFKKPKLSNDW